MVVKGLSWLFGSWGRLHQSSLTSHELRNVIPRETELDFVDRKPLQHLRIVMLFSVFFYKKKSLNPSSHLFLKLCWGTETVSCCPSLLLTCRTDRNWNLKKNNQTKQTNLISSSHSLFRYWFNSFKSAVYVDTNESLCFIFATPRS